MIQNAIEYAYLCRSIAGGWHDNKCTRRLGVDIKMSIEIYMTHLLKQCFRAYQISEMTVDQNYLRLL